MKSNLDRIRMHFSDTDTPNSYGVECLLRLKGVQVTQIYTDYEQNPPFGRIFLSISSYT
jgi:hypothetical protein